jgi:glutaredoxin
MQVVYSKDNCPGCKRLISEYEMNGWLEGREFRVVKIGTDITLEEFISKFPTVRSVPYVTED